MREVQSLLFIMSIKYDEYTRHGSEYVKETKMYVDTFKSLLNTGNVYDSKKYITKIFTSRIHNAY